METAAREVEAVGITRLREQRPRVLGRERDLREIGVEAVQAVRHDPVFEQTASAVGRVEQDRPVQPELKRLSDARVVQRPDGFIQRDIGDADALHVVKTVLIDVAVEEKLRGFADVVQIQNVQTAALEQQADFLRAGHEAQIQTRAAGRALPAVRVRREQHASARLPAAQDEGAGPDRPVRVGPEAVSGGFGRLGVQDGGAGHGQTGEEGLKGALERNREIQFTEDLKALEPIRFSGLQPVRTHNIVGNVPVAGIRMGEQPREGIQHVRRGQRRAVAERHALAQMEDVTAAVRGDLPALCQRGQDHRVPVGVVLHLHQPVKDILGDGVVDRRALEIHGIRLVLNGDEVTGGVRLPGDGLRRGGFPASALIGAGGQSAGQQHGCQQQAKRPFAAVEKHHGAFSC